MRLAGDTGEKNDDLTCTLVGSWFPYRSRTSSFWSGHVLLACLNVQFQVNGSCFHSLYEGVLGNPDTILKLPLL